MARPKKETVDYFPHMVKHKRTMHIIRNRYGNDGYVFWFVLLEILGNTEHHFYDCSDALSWEFLVAETRVSADICTEILDLLAVLGAIDSELWSVKVIWSQNFVDGIAPVYIKRKVETPTAPYFLLQKPASAEVSTVENPQSRVEESRVEKKHVSFSQFWDLSPERHGKKRLKKEAKDYWLKHITNGKAEKVLVAVKNYADSKDVKAGIGIRDPIRFLRNDYWKEWLEPEKGPEVKAGPKKSLDQRIKERDEREGVKNAG